MLPILTGLLLLVARGTAQSSSADAPALQRTNGAAAPSPSTSVPGTPKECIIAVDAASTVFEEYYDTKLYQKTTGSSLCSLLGVESFDGDQAYSVIFWGSTDSPGLDTIQATIGDVKTFFDDGGNITRASVSLLYKAVAAQQYYFDSLMSNSGQSIVLTNLTTAALALDPSAAEAAPSPPAAAPPASSRRLQQAARRGAGARRLQDSGSADALCDTSKAFSKAIVAAAQDLGPLCPGAAADRLAVARRDVQTCAAALVGCRDPEPLEAAACGRKRSACNARLAQLLVCAAGRRAEAALEAGARKQLGCDLVERDAEFSRGCSGSVEYITEGRLSEAELANRNGITVEEIRAANGGRATADGPLCVPARPLQCGETLVVSSGIPPYIFTVPLEGKQSASVSWAPTQGEGIGMNVRVRDQQTGNIFYSNWALSEGTKSFELREGTSELAVLLGYKRFEDTPWNISVSCA